MTNDETMTELKARKANARGVIPASSFRFPSSFVILLRHRASAKLAEGSEFVQVCPPVPMFSIPRP